MKLAEMRDLTIEEIPQRLEALSKELYEARFQKATHQLDDTAKFRRIKHQMAQLKTILRQKEHAAQGDKTNA